MCTLYWDFGFQINTSHTEGRLWLKDDEVLLSWGSQSCRETDRWVDTHSRASTWMDNQLVEGVMMTNSFFESESGARRLDIRVTFCKIEIRILCSLLLGRQEQVLPNITSLWTIHSPALRSAGSFSSSRSQWESPLQGHQTSLWTTPFLHSPHPPQQAVSLHLSLHHGTERAIPGMVFELLPHGPVSFLWRKNHVYFGYISGNLGEISNGTKK